MPNGYDETEDLGQDYREPSVVAPVVAAPPRAAVAAPGGTAIAPPPAASPFLSPSQAAQQETMRRLQYQVRDLPLAEAEQAVSTALKFQAIRGYQKDLQAGVTAPEALARWAPIMFSQPKAGTLGQAASMVRAGTPQEKYMDIGGVGYQMKAGKAIPLTTKAPTVKPITLTVPTDPADPFAGRVSIPLDKEDPLVKDTLARARKGPVPPEPEPPGLFERLFGRKTAAAPAAPVPADVTPPAVSPVTPPAAIKVRRSPEEKLDAARALRKLHPDWTKQRILDEVNR